MIIQVYCTLYLIILLYVLYFIIISALEIKPLYYYEILFLYIVQLCFMLYHMDDFYDKKRRKR